MRYHKISFIFVISIVDLVGFDQATGMTKISRGAVFSKIFRPGGVFYRKFRILTGSRVFSLIKT